MEHASYVMIEESTFSIIVVGHRGTQQLLRFHPVQFYNVVEYLQSRMHPNHILYIR